MLEFKRVQKMTGVHKMQLLTDLKLTDCCQGLLINLDVDPIQEAMLRVAYDLEE
jgi:hypothetical protein